MKIYIAGPDVFRPDAAAWAAAMHTACSARGHEALVPLDGSARTAAGIFASNVAMIRAADALIANLNAFRGNEPDSGTCFELGVAVALGKRCVGYVAEPGLLHERVARWQGAALQPDPQGWTDRDGQRVENFGLPLNLMLAVPATIVVGDFDTALTRLLAS